MVDRADILAKLRRTTEQNDGVPLSSRRFSEETGIRTEDLQRAGWPSHGALLKSQGFIPRSLKPAYSDDRLLEPLAQLTLSLGHFPNHSERAVERHRNPGFPSNEAYLRRARQETLEQALLNWVRATGIHPHVAAIIERLPGIANEDVAKPIVQGYVYLIKAGKNWKIGRETTKGARASAAGTWHEDPKVLHSIATDDPAGVEAYWHRRFKDKNVKGELFKLTREDVAAFKRWKKII